LIEAYTEQAISQINYEEDLWILNLSEVKIEAQKIPDKMKLIGLSSYRFEGKALEKPIQINNILSLINTQRGVNSMLVNSSPIYILDGMEISLREYKEGPALLPAYMFESVEILRPEDSFARYGFRAPNGAYVMETKKNLGINHVTPDTSIEIYRPEGYCVLKEFYVPAYDQPEIRQRKTPDLRTTIYWNPVVCADSSGKAEVSFFTADHTASYSYILEGIGNNKIVFSKINMGAEKLNSKHNP